MRSFHIGKEIKGVLQGFRTRVILQRRVCCFQGVGPLGAAFSSGSWGRFYSREGLSCSWSNHRQTSIVSGDEDDAFAIRALLQHGPQPSPRRRRSRSLRAQRLQSRIPTHPSGLTLHPFPRALPSEPKRPSDLPSVCPQLPVSDPPLCLARGPTVRATGPQVAPAMGSAPWTPGLRGWGPGRECQSLLKPAVTRRGVGASRRSQSRPQVSRAGLAAGAGPGGGRQQGRSSAPGCHAALRAHWRWPWCWAPRSRQRRGALATLLPGR